MDNLRDVPWSAILTVLVLAWSIGMLAMVEYMRRTFATREQVGDMKAALVEHGKDLKTWETEVDQRFASRVELDGVGSKVNNLTHMFTSTHAIAEEAKERSKETQGDMRHLTQQVAGMAAQVAATGGKVDRMTELFAELRGEIRASQQHKEPR